jgi:hypothetical protein
VWNIKDVSSNAGLNRLANAVNQVSDTTELDDMNDAVRQEARRHYGASDKWPSSVKTLLTAISDRQVAVAIQNSKTKTNLNKTKQPHQVAPPANQGAPPSRTAPSVNQSPPNLPAGPSVNQGQPNPAVAVSSSPPPTTVNQAAPVVAHVTAGALKGTYNLRDRAARAKFLNGVRSATSGHWLKRIEEAFEAAVAGLPNADSEFADVRKAIADKATDLAKPPATNVQLKGYEDLTKWSQNGLPLYGSTLMKRVELASVPSRSGEEADHQSRNYTLNLTIPARLQSDRAVAVATHIANSLHANNIHGVDLRQVVKIKDGTNELYHLNIHIPHAGKPTDPPAQIDVTLDTVKVDNAVAGKVVGFHELDAELSGRILQVKGDVNLDADYDVRKSPRPLAIRTKEWLTTETEVLKRAVGLIPPEHLSLLPNLKFVRVEALPGAGNQAPAEYYPTDPPVICISDKVVDPNYNEYLYDGQKDEVLPKAVRMIVHEVGHAVSLEKWRQSALKFRGDAVNNAAELKSLGGSRAMDATPIAALDGFIASGEFVTDYAASEELDNKNRDSARAELFAEAYSLWVTNRSYLTKNHPQLAAWFGAQKF